MATGNPRRKLRQDGTVAWQARYRDPDGRQRAREFTKKVDAERFLATTRADMARGDWINPADAKRLFADVAEHWRTTRVHADTTAAAVAGDLRNHILPAFGDQEIGRIRHSDVQAWVRRLSERLAPTTVDRSYRWLAAIFRLAVNDDLIRRSPCFAIKLPVKPEARVEPLRREDVEALFEALPARYRALAVVGAGAGLRQGEAFGLTVPNIDFLRGREIRVRQQLKTSPRTLPTSAGRRPPPASGRFPSAARSSRPSPATSSSSRRRPSSSVIRRGSRSSWFSPTTKASHCAVTGSPVSGAGPAVTLGFPRASRITISATISPLC